MIRRADADDLPVWAKMLASLHYDVSAEEWTAELEVLTKLRKPYVGFLSLTDEGEPIGMIDARERNYAEGAPHLRAAYVEDLWVEPAHRRQGVAAMLLRMVEEWAKGEEFDWLGSDAVIGNCESHEWHRSMGFAETERLVVFGKRLARLECTSTHG